MPSTSLHLPTAIPLAAADGSTSNPLPQLLQTPSGLAILEIQGTIHAPFPSSSSDHDHLPTPQTSQTEIGRLEFPLYDPHGEASAGAGGEGKWMKKVYLYVGKHQRLTGEVKKLGKPLGVLRKKAVERGDVLQAPDAGLEIAEVVRYKVVFAGRPEPVGGE